MIGNVVEKTRLVEVRTSGQQVDPPFTGSAFQLCSVETLPYIGTFANRNQPPRSVVQLLPARLQDNPVIAVVVPTSTNAASKSSFFSSIGLGPPLRNDSNRS